MRIFGITVCHVNPDILAFSLNKVLGTFGDIEIIDDWVLVDNLWPINPKATSQILNNIANAGLYSVIEVQGGNKGGLHGFNSGLEYLNNKYTLGDGDFIFGIDPDTNPITLRWGEAMLESFRENNLDAISLMIKSLKPIRPWVTYKTSPHKLVKHFDMYNATCWRYGAIKNGLKANLAQYYGGVELGMKHLNHAYLYDFEEDHCPIPHHQCYNEWKRKHAFEGYAGNFDQYLRDFHPEML